ncbi:MAG: hypothetical protein DSY80_01510 [Desulfocapsa sp.]|nr:MAG: hypothetical protein DSY80_01510 [Desulfocapsa sp.]
MVSKICTVAVLLCLFTFTPSLPRAEEKDPVIQTIEQALAEYKKQNYSNAATSLDYASQLIRQKKGDALGAFLPEPMEGWTANESKSQVTAASLFGGGLTAAREYTKDDTRIQIEIVTDSPLLQPMIMMFSNPIFAASAGRFELINGYKGIIKHQNNSGDINIVVNNRFLVTVKGRNVTEEELVGYAKHIDLKGIANLP